MCARCRRRATPASSTRTRLRGIISARRRTLSTGRRSARAICAIISATISATPSARGSSSSTAMRPKSASCRKRARCGCTEAGSSSPEHMRIEHIAAKVRAGERLGADEALDIYRHAPTPLLARLADTVRARKHPEGIVTYIIDRNVNYTNVCVAKCNFCAFYRDVGSREGYVLGFEEIFLKIDETIAVGGAQLLLQGGHNPDLPLTWYEDLFRAVKERYPAFKLHALSPPEVIHLSRLSQLPVPAVIDRLIAAGLDSNRPRRPPHAGRRAHRARQLRQPPGVVGDAGRQGGPVEPRVRRERHG